MMSLRKSLPTPNSTKLPVSETKCRSKSISPRRPRFKRRYCENSADNEKRVLSEKTKQKVGTLIAARRVSCRQRKPYVRFCYDESGEIETVEKQIKPSSTLKFSSIIKKNSQNPSSALVKKEIENKKSSLNNKFMGGDGDTNSNTKKEEKNDSNSYTNVENTQQPYVINGRSLRKRRLSGTSNSSFSGDAHDQKMCSVLSQTSPRTIRNNGKTVRLKTENVLDVVINKDINLSSPLQSCECSNDSFSIQADRANGADINNASLCGALECIGSSTTGCFNSSKDSSLYRVSHLTPFRLLCSSHLTRQRSHQCCPLCGRFCSEGDEIISCAGRPSAMKSSTCHLFHKACAFLAMFPPTSKKFKIHCPHCGEEENLCRKSLGVLSSESPIFLPDRSLKSRTFGYNLLPTLAKPEGLEDHFLKAINRVSLASLASLIQLEGLHTTLNEPGFPLTDELFLDAIERRSLIEVYKHLSMCGEPNICFPSRDMKTPLHLAVESKDIVLLHIICEAEIETNVNVFDMDGITALMVAARLNDPVAINYLISASADHLIQDKNGLTLLHHAVQAGSLDAVNTILEYDKSLLNSSDSMGLTPLMLAAKSKFREMANCISKHLEYERRAVLELDNENNTSLHWAGKIGCIQIALRLLKYGALMDAQNDSGETPLHVAVKSGQFTFAICLLKKGADPFITDREGHNIVYLCTSEGTWNSENQSKIEFVKAKQALLFVLGQKKIKYTDGSYKTGKMGFLKSDISKGNENLRISCVNTVDQKKLTLDFIYTTLTIPLRSYFGKIPYQPPLHNCHCKSDSTSHINCQDHDSTTELFYDLDGRLFEGANGERNFKLGIVTECGPECSCDRRQCKNRVVQNGIKALLQVFHTPIIEGMTKGWGIRTLTTISMGSFICEYTGELLSLIEMESRSDDSYVIDLFRSESNESVGFVIDSKFKGNLARFINHSCDANAVLVKVVTPSCNDFRIPKVALFARRTILNNEEITFDYGKYFWDMKITRDKQFCLCKSPNCLYGNKESLI